MTREQAIEVLTSTIIGEEIGMGGYPLPTSSPMVTSAKRLLA
jgi:hypothetical protein